MSTKILIGVLVALLAAAGWVIYSGNQKHEEATDASRTSISFICGDGSHFIAEFPDDMRTLSVVVDGVTVRTLPQVAGVGMRFGNAAYTYAFAGEEVTVTTDNFSTVCTQPFDPNLAPYNFGDVGEGAGAENDMAVAVTTNIVGTWQSTDDEKFVRKFNGDGTMADLYDGAITATGTWAAFSGDHQPEVSFQVEPHSVYLALTTADMPDEPLHFKVVKLTPDALELIYMERGGTLSFTKVQ